MKDPVFYQLELRKVENVMEHVYGPGAKGMTLEERLPNNAACPDCGENVWHLYANESPEVREGGKPYIYCQNCGYRTHL